MSGADQRDFVGGLSLGGDVKSVVLHAPANATTTVYTPTRGGRFVVYSLFAICSAGGTAKFTSGGVDITGTMAVALNQVVQISNNGVPVLKGLKAGDALAIVTAGGAVLDGTIILGESQR